MPELPEVEHVVRALRPIVTGRRILAAELNLQRIAPELSRVAFGRQLRDVVITGVGRRGKYILFELEERLGTRILEALYAEGTGDESKGSARSRSAESEPGEHPADEDAIDDDQLAPDPNPTRRT